MSNRPRRPCAAHASFVRKNVSTTPAFIVAVPIESVGKNRALRHLKAKALDVGDPDQKTCERLSVLLDAELLRRLDGVDKDGTGARQPHHLGVRRLRLQEKR